MPTFYAPEVKTSHAEVLFNKYCNLIGYRLLAYYLLHDDDDDVVYKVSSRSVWL